jgi:hypothetical protein
MRTRHEVSFFYSVFFFLEHIGALGVIILRNIRKFDYTKHLRRKKKYRFWKIDQRQTTDNRTTRTAGGPILAPPSCTTVQPRPWHSRAEAAAPSNTPALWCFQMDHVTSISVYDTGIDRPNGRSEHHVIFLSCMQALHHHICHFSMCWFDAFFLFFVKS